MWGRGEVKVVHAAIFTAFGCDFYRLVKGLTIMSIYSDASFCIVQRG